MNSPETPDSGCGDPALDGLEAGFLVGGGRYTLRRITRAGACGPVWLALDNQLQEEVALKFLLNSLVSDAVSFDEFRRRVQQCRKLSHVGIVRIYDLFSAPDEPAFLAMEYVDGVDLGTSRLDHPDQVFSWEDLNPMAEQVCAALAYAHADGLAHGNIKPSNMLVQRSGRIKLANFGLSYGAFSATPDHLPYTSPQRLAGGMPDVLDDIYSLGAVLYESLTGSVPFVTGDIPYQIQNVRPPPISERLLEAGIQREVPEKISTLIQACLAKDRSERPPAAALITDILPQDAESPSLIAPPPTPAEEAAAFVRTSPEEPSEEQSDAEKVPAPRRIVNWKNLVVAFGIIVLASGSAWQFWRPERHIDQAPSATVSQPAAPIQPKNEVLPDLPLKPSGPPPKGTYVGEGPGFSYRYAPREAHDVDTNAINVGVRFSGEGAETAHCSYVCASGATNYSIGTITYNFRAADGYMIEDMHLSQSTTLYTSGRIRGMYSVDGGRTFIEFYLSPPFRGKSFSFARSVDLPSLNSSNVLIRYILHRYAGADYKLQFLRDCDDGPTPLEITGSVRPQPRRAEPKKNESAP